MRKVCGVGINDADYVVHKTETVSYVNRKQKTKLLWVCPFYRKWKSMLERCYSEKLKKKYPTYEECVVCSEWLSFMRFKAWMETQDWEGKQLDKDLLVKGNKLYGPETCVFVSKDLNLFLLETAKTRGDWPIGVCFNQTNKKFVATCSDPFLKKNEFLGYYNTPEEAHKAWLFRKREFAKVLAEQQSDPRISSILVGRYENY